MVVNWNTDRWGRGVTAPVTGGSWSPELPCLGTLHKLITIPEERSSVANNMALPFNQHVTTN